MAQASPLHLFISYSHKDDICRQDLEAHLSPLKRQGILDVWSDQAIEAGEEWEQSISEKLEAADIILLLVSPDFLASEFISEKELKRAMDRHEAGQTRVIPVFLRPCHWKGEIFGKLQGVPDDAKPVSRWEDRDEAFACIAEAISKTAEVLARDIAKRKAEKAWDEAVRIHTVEAYRAYLEVYPQGEHAPEAAFNLGLMYAEGDGVPQDYAEAVRWYRKAAEQDYAPAQFNLGRMSETGRGVPKNYAQAVQWYRKAAEQGYAVGQRGLGWMYQNGFGVPQDDALAVQ